MVILREATIKKFGYDPNDLKSKSHKKICCSCDDCNKIRYVRLGAYTDLCRSCSVLGKNNGMFSKKHTNKTKQKMSKSHSGELNHFYGKHHSKESKEKNRNAHLGKNIGKDNPMWGGGFDRRKLYLTPINQCIQLNKRFQGSEGHHITSGVIIYIPKDIHKNIRHNMKSGKNMNKINKLAIDYLVGDI